MHTVENEKIRVTVTDQVWDSYQQKLLLSCKQILPSGDIRYHNEENVRRGLILSDAFEQLKCRQEYKIRSSIDFSIDKKHPIYEFEPVALQLSIMWGWTEQDLSGFSTEKIQEVWNYKSGLMLIWSKILNYYNGRSYWDGFDIVVFADTPFDDEIDFS